MNVFHLIFSSVDISVNKPSKKVLVYLCLKVLFNQLPAGILAHDAYVIHQREIKEQTSAADSSCSNYSQFTNTLHIRNAKPPRLCVDNFMSFWVLTLHRGGIYFTSRSSYLPLNEGTSAYRICPPSKNNLNRFFGIILLSVKNVPSFPIDVGIIIICCNYNSKFPIKLIFWEALTLIIVIIKQVFYINVFGKQFH
jgi:hypothetical protein